MQALQANELQTFYWMPSNEVGNGELDFVFQDSEARIIPVEVKSSRNVKAKTLTAFVEASKPSAAYRLAEKNFDTEPIEGTRTKSVSLPLYAAFCIGHD